MLQRLIFDDVDMYPGPDSQTVSTWPLVVQIGEEQLTSAMVSLDSGQFIIQPPREKPWDEVVEEVLHDRAELWKRLADL